MGRFTKSIVLGLTIAALCAVAAIGLGGCGNGGTAGSTAGSGPIWVKTSETYYDEKGNVLESNTFELDSRGNVVKETSSRGMASEEISEFSDFTPEGYAQTITGFIEDKRVVVTYIYTIENGHAITREEDAPDPSSSRKFTYTYYTNGVLKSSTLDWGSDRDYWSYDYDEQGYCTHTLGMRGDTTTFESTWEWAFDSAGNPTGFIRTEKGHDRSGTPIEYKVQCDENGNIIRIYDAKGHVVAELEYTRIDNPSMAAWVDANTKDYNL